MFLNNSQACMDSALEALAESLDYFYDNTSRLSPKIRETLTTHFETRRDDVMALRESARLHMKILPRDADVERDDYRWLWSRLKGVVGGNSQVLLNDFQEQERAVMRALGNAWTYPLPEEIDPMIEQLLLRCRALLRDIFACQQHTHNRLQKRNRNPPLD